LLITPVKDFTSFDTIIVRLMCGIRDEYGALFDGNQNGDPDGSPTDDYSFSFRTALLGDYNLDKAIDIADFQILRDAWLSSPPDYFYELGPVTGTLPHYQLQRDRKFDIYDLASLGTMWNWYIAQIIGRPIPWAKSNPGQTLPLVISNSFSKSPVWNSASKELSLDLEWPAQTRFSGLELLVSYDPSAVEYREFVSCLPPENSGGWLVLDQCFPERGAIAIVMFCFNGEDFTSPKMGIIGRICFESKINTETEITYSAALAVQEKDSTRIVADQASYKFATHPPVPERFALHQSFPNPFNSSTMIRYEIPRACAVHLCIYDLHGNQVKTIINTQHEPGYYERIWDGRNDHGTSMASGVYIYRISAGAFCSAKKLILMK